MQIYDLCKDVVFASDKFSLWLRPWIKMLLLWVCPRRRGDASVAAGRSVTLASFTASMHYRAAYRG